MYIPVWERLLSCPTAAKGVYRAYQQVSELSLTRASVDFRLIKPFSLLLPQSPKPNKWQIFKALFSIYHVTSWCDSRHDLCWYFYSRLAFLSFTVLQQNWDKQLNIDLSRRQLGNNHVTNTQTINSQQTLHGNQMEKKHPRFFQFPDVGNGKTIPEYLNIQYVLNTQVVIWSFTHISTKYFQSINGKHTSKRPLVCDN